MNGNRLGHQHANQYCMICAFNWCERWMAKEAQPNCNDTQTTLEGDKKICSAYWHLLWIISHYHWMSSSLSLSFKIEAADTEHTECWCNLFKMKNHRKIIHSFGHVFGSMLVWYEAYSPAHEPLNWLNSTKTPPMPMAINSKAKTDNSQHERKMKNNQLTPQHKKQLAQTMPIFMFRHF